MTKRVKNNCAKISFTLSLISIAITFFINYQIAEVYLKSGGKTRALFGIKELYQFGYQYYVVVIGSLSLVLAILSINTKAQEGKAVAVILLSLLAIFAVFARGWRLFV